MKSISELINEDFKWIDECEDIAEVIEEQLYDTICWRLDEADAIPDDDDGEAMNALHAEAFEQVIAILASRCFYHIDLQK